MQQINKWAGQASWASTREVTSLLGQSTVYKYCGVRAQ